MKRLVLFIPTLLIFIYGNGQELFPLNEPASTIPRNTLGVRLFGNVYQEPNNQYRQMYALRLMYGLFPNCSIYITPSASNHHSNTLPPSFPDHNTPQIGVPLPFRFNGVSFYAKYRFYSNDAEKRHFRIAAFAEWAQLDVPHDEAEPTLLDDTKGFSAGIITTYLKDHFAVSFNGGIILPMAYKGEVPNEIHGLQSVPAIVRYGRAVTYNLSMGYLLFPRHYKSYNQTSWNLYLELMGKSYEGIRISFDNIAQPGTWYNVPIRDNDALLKGNYIEIHPGLQCIIRSNLRLDLSVALPFYGKSYVRFYPQYEIGIQRYFYFLKQK